MGECQVETWLCHSCRRPLNRYSFNANDGSKRLFCTASCFKAFTREERWTMRMIHDFFVRETLPASSYEAGNDGRQKDHPQEEAQSLKAATILVALHTGALAAIAS